LQAAVACGSAQGSQAAAEQPYAGSPIATHWEAHVFWSGAHAGPASAPPVPLVELVVLLVVLVVLLVVLLVVDDVLVVLVVVDDVLVVLLVELVVLVDVVLVVAPVLLVDDALVAPPAPVPPLPEEMTVGSQPAPTSRIEPART
jgi:hypothetical protein